MTISQNDIALANILDHVENLARIHPPWAPALQITTGFAAGIDCTGCNLDPLKSLQACGGEAAEILAQSREIADFLLTDGFNTPQALRPFAKRGKGRFVEAIDIPTQKTYSVPANLCFSGERIDHQDIISTGCAAGPTRLSALASSLCETVEHAAISDWWQGTNYLSSPHQHPPISIDTEMEEKIKTYRQGKTNRLTRIAQIAYFADIHVAAAWSIDARSGQAFVVAASAAFTLEEAADKALRELCQMELGLGIALQIQSENPDNLSPTDKARLVMATAIKADDPRLQTISDLQFRPASAQADTLPECPILRRAHLIAQESEHCLEITLHDQPGLHVVKTIVPAWVYTHAPLC